MAAAGPLPSVHYYDPGGEKAMRTRLGLFLLLFVASSFACAAGCRPQDGTETSGACADAPLASYQAELLDIAFDAASAMPIKPHIKNRSRAQEVVVLTCLELGQPQRARRYLEQIANWRREAAYADLAFYYAERGATDPVESCLKLAAEVPEVADGWRVDRIKAKIAATRAYLGQSQAVEIQAIAAAERGPVVRVQAMVCPPEAFDEQMAFLGQETAVGNFETVTNALAAYAELYDRFYANPERRQAIEQKIKALWTSLPIVVRLGRVMKLIEACFTHDDLPKALELVDEAKTMMDRANWQPQYVIPLKARLASLRFRAGDKVNAVTEAKATLELFDAKRETIANIYRAQMLRPIAEAFYTLGDTAAALDLYKRAVEAGMENPNSRPRADDLVATCCSLALHAVEPDATLAARIREIRQGLGNPW
jgi:tetratricopeptide (TPR) repeat protein